MLSNMFAGLGALAGDLVPAISHVLEAKSTFASLVVGEVENLAAADIPSLVSRLKLPADAISKISSDTGIASATIGAAEGIVDGLIAGEASKAVSGLLNIDSAVPVAEIPTPAEAGASGAAFSGGDISVA
jgi:hypothetical protein